jgi:hypothetical protein
MLPPNYSIRPEDQQTPSVSYIILKTALHLELTRLEFKLEIKIGIPYVIFIFLLKYVFSVKFKNHFEFSFLLSDHTMFSYLSFNNVSALISCDREPLTHKNPINNLSHRK